MFSSSVRSLLASVAIVTLFLVAGCRKSGPTNDTVASLPEGASVSSSSAGAPTPSSPAPTKKKDPGGHYNEEGEWIPDNKTIARTYKIPDLSAGFMYDTKRLRPCLAVELFDKRTCAMDIVGAEDFIGLSISKRWTSIFEIKTGIGAGWDFERGWDHDDGEAGWNFFVHVLIIKF